MQRCLLYRCSKSESVVHGCIAQRIVHIHTWRCSQLRAVLYLTAYLSSTPQEAFASVDAYADRVEIRGFGVITSRVLHFQPRVGELVIG